MSGKPATSFDPEERALAEVIIRTLTYIVKWLKRRYHITE